MSGGRRFLFAAWDGGGAVPPMLRNETSRSEDEVPNSWKRNTAQMMTGRIMYSRGHCPRSDPR